jgi:hypothetical protein
MKSILKITILAFIIFSILVLVTKKIETPFDGHDTYGFPLTFHTTFSRMCNPCPTKMSYTNYWNLLADLGFAFISGFAIWKGIIFFKNKMGKYAG